MRAKSYILQSDIMHYGYLEVFFPLFSWNARISFFSSIFTSSVKKAPIRDKGLATQPPWYRFCPHTVSVKWRVICQNSKADVSLWSPEMLLFGVYLFVAALALASPPPHLPSMQWAWPKKSNPSKWGWEPTFVYPAHAQTCSTEPNNIRIMHGKGGGVSYICRQWGGGGGPEVMIRQWCWDTWQQPRNTCIDDESASFS